MQSGRGREIDLGDGGVEGFALDGGEFEFFGGGLAGAVATLVGRGG